MMNNCLSRQLVLAVLGVALALPAFAQNANFRVVTLVGGLEYPWSLAFLPDGRRLVTEKPGRLRLITADNQLLPEPVAGLPDNIVAQSQGGLFDVLPHPQFADNQLLYLAYTGRGEGGLGTEVARGRLVDGRLENVEVLFKALPKVSGGRHFGGRLLFGPDGQLYITLGDRGQQDHAQDAGNHLGSLIRLSPDGQVPADNPFVNDPGKQREIYTYGNRNIQGIALQPGSERIWMHEHGPRGGDEVNIVQAGANYGWPAVTHGIDYSGAVISEQRTAPGITESVHVWVPSIAPSGMAFYDGEQFPGWRGDLFVGALRDQMLVRLDIEGGQVIGEERLLQGELGRIRDVRQGPDGYLYLLTDSPSGRLVRLEPAAS